MTEAQLREPLAGIAVVGMAGRFPGAEGLAGLWANLAGGVESISFFPDEELLAAGADPALLADPAFVPAKAVLSDVEGFDAAFFGFTPREAELMDPQHRLLLECAWEAFEDAGYDPARAGGRAGVYVGSGASLYLLNNLLPNAARLELAGALQVMLLNDRDFLATRLSHKLDLKGPSVLVQTACSTGLVAVHTACQALLAEEIDLALAGGISISVPQVEGYLYQEGGISSADGHCRAFDAGATGSVAGNGAGLVVLKRVADALAAGDRIYAVIRGTAANNDGADKVGFTAPSVSGQAAVIAESLAMAGVEAETIALVEGHGSGTALGDPIEVAALREAFGASGRRCALGSVKSNFGHLNTAAGIAGLIKAVLAVERGVIPPSLHFETPNPEADFGPFYVPTAAEPWPSELAPRRAGVSSFGLGGTNVHAVVEEAPPREASDSGRACQLLLVSARSEKALSAACQRLAETLKASALSSPSSPSLGEEGRGGEGQGEEGRGGEGRGEEGRSLADVAFTLHAGRRSFAHRRAVVATTVEEAVAALREGKGASGVAAPRSVVFLFPGLGDHYVDVARGLYESEPVFARGLDRCADLLLPILGVDVREIVFPPSTGGSATAKPEGTDLRALLRRGGGVGEDAASRRLAQTENAQPILFAVEYALGRLLLAWGIRPAAMIGYSIGEYVAACLAGVLSLEDAISLVARRAKLIAALPGGALLAVPLTEAEIPLSGGLAVSATNGPHLTVVGGPEDEVEALRQRLDARGVVCLRVATTHAFHTPMLAPAEAALTELARTVRTAPPEIPYLSNVTGTWITERDVADPGYWARHMCRPVRFAEGLGEILAESGRALVEVGPGGTLCTLARQHPRGGEAFAVTTLRRASDGGADQAVLLAALGALWTTGVAIGAEGFYAGQKRRRVGLPTYPFERTRCWIEPPVRGERPQTQPAGRAPLADWFWVPSWRQVPLVPRSSNGQAPPRRVVWKAEEGPVALVLLCQSLAASGEPAAVTVVGSGLARVHPGEPVEPARAAVLGAVRLIHQELPAVTCRAVDVRGEPDATLLAVEADFAPAGAVVALRGRQRWVRGYEPVHLAETATVPAAGSVCLVTDGAHGAGQAIAKLLAPTHRVAVVVPEGFAAGLDPSIVVVQAGDPQSALAAVEAQWGPVETVFHTGGAFSGGLIQLKTAEGLDATLSGVAAGAEAWIAALEASPQPPSRLVLVSSTLAATGGFGQLDIALASSYFDALAEARSELDAPFVTVATHWDPYQWDGWLIAAAAGGMAGLDQESVAQNLAANALASRDSGEALGRLLAAGLPRVLVAARPLPALLEEADLATAELLAAQLAPAARGGEKAPRPELASAYVAPRDEREERLVTLWQELFGIAPIGVEDSFLELGGHSLLAIQVVTQVRTHFAAELPVTVLFESPTVAELAKAVGRARGEESEEDLEALLALVEGLSPEEAAARLAGLEPPKVLHPPPVRPVSGPTAVGDWPLTFDQERLWRLHREDPGLVSWNVDATSHVQGAIDVACLLAAFDGLLERHPAWRAAFPLVDGQPVQRIAERGAIDFALLDLTALPPLRAEAEGRRAHYDRTRVRFDLGRGPLVRVTLAKLGEPEYLFVVTVHHLVTDWITFQVYTRELGLFYEAARTGKPVALPPMPVQFPDYVFWEREWMAGEVLAEHVRFWRRELAGYPLVLDLPGDRPRPAVQSQRGGMIPAQTGPGPAARLRAVARREGATSFMALLAVIAALVHRLTGREKVIIGSNSANRPRPELAEVFGFFLTQVPFAVDLAGDPTFRELLARARKAALAAYPYQSFPFAKLIEALGVEDDRSRNPVVQVLLLVLDGKSSQSDGEQSSAATSLYDGNSRWDLMFGLYDYDDLGFSGPVEYNADVFTRERMEHVLSLFYRLVEAVGENPDVRLSRLPVGEEVAA